MKIKYRTEIISNVYIFFVLDICKTYCHISFRRKNIYIENIKAIKYSKKKKNLLNLFFVRRKKKSISLILH